MKPTLYLETTVVSYLVARPSDNLVVAAHQQVTYQWWNKRLPDFQVVVSQFVLDEAGDGEPVMARKRMAALKAFERLKTSPEVLRLGRALLRTNMFPQESARDASHISVAAVYGIHFLLTWNFKHLANARLVDRVRQVCREEGFSCPVICTPEELLEV